LEPLASAARPIERRTASICSTIRCQLGTKRAHHVRPQQLALPVSREAEGKQLADTEDVDRTPGFPLEAQQLHLEGHRLRICSGGVDALAKALEQGPQLRLELLGLALGRATDPQREHQPIDRQALGPSHLGDPPRDDAAVEVHLPEPVLAVAKTRGEPEVAGVVSGDVRHAPAVALDADRPVKPGE
jgi:hypothetical protein